MHSEWLLKYFWLVAARAYIRDFPPKLAWGIGPFVVYSLDFPN
jgi:hypothetical protein